MDKAVFLIPVIIAFAVAYAAMFRFSRLYQSCGFCAKKYFPDFLGKYFIAYIFIIVSAVFLMAGSALMGIELVWWSGSCFAISLLAGIFGIMRIKPNKQQTQPRLLRILSFGFIFVLVLALLSYLGAPPVAAALPVLSPVIVPAISAIMRPLEKKISRCAIKTRERI